MSSTLNGSSVIRHFEHGNAIKIYSRIVFDFYTGCHICESGTLDTLPLISVSLKNLLPAIFSCTPQIQHYCVM